MKVHLFKMKLCGSCRYPQPVMDKVKEMAEGITVKDAPQWKTRDEIMGKAKRPASSGKI